MKEYSSPYELVPYRGRKNGGCISCIFLNLDTVQQQLSENSPTCPTMTNESGSETLVCSSEPNLFSFRLVHKLTGEVVTREDAKELVKEVGHVTRKPLYVGS